METHVSATDYTACPECDLLHEVKPLAAGDKAHCARCGAFLQWGGKPALTELSALALSGIILMLLVLSFPLVSIQAGGPAFEKNVLTAGTALADQGMPVIALLVVLTSLACPLLVLLAVVYITVPLQQGIVAPGCRWLLKLIREIKPWSLLPVFLLGVLIAVVKLMPMVRLNPGVALFSLLALVVVYGAFLTKLDLPSIWSHLPSPSVASRDLAAQRVSRCTECTLLVSSSTQECPRCGSHVHARKPGSLQKTAALLSAAAVLFVPANLIPVMTVSKLGDTHQDTIFSGVLSLAEAGLYGLAIIVVVASLVVPMAKLAILGMLLLSVQQKWKWRPRDRTRLFRAVELIGSWSMVDVYVVGLLTALVSLGPLGTVKPEPGILYFGAVVVLTMLAAHSFDPRLIWDSAERNTRP